MILGLIGKLSQKDANIIDSIIRASSDLILVSGPQDRFFIDFELRIATLVGFARFWLDLERFGEISRDLVKSSQEFPSILLRESLLFFARIWLDVRMIIDCVARFSRDIALRTCSYVMRLAGNTRILAGFTRFVYFA